MKSAVTWHYVSLVSQSLYATFFLAYGEYFWAALALIFAAFAFVMLVVG